MIDEIPGEYPKYMMKVAGKKILMPFMQACISYDSGYLDVEFGDVVKVDDSSLREMTEEDQKQIKEGADKISTTK